MAPHTSKTKANATMLATKMRKKGFEASVYKKKKGYGVSVTRR